MLKQLEPERRAGRDLDVVRRVVELRERDAVGNDRLAEKLVGMAMMWAASSR